MLSELSVAQNKSGMIPFVFLLCQWEKAFKAGVSLNLSEVLENLKRN